MESDNAGDPRHPLTGVDPAGLVRCVGVAFDGGEAVLASVAGAVDGDGDGDDVAVVQEAVEDRGRQDLVSEHLSPFAEGLVRGQDDRAAFVAVLGDDLGRWLTR